MPHRSIELAMAVVLTVAPAVGCAATEQAGDGDSGLASGELGASRPYLALGDSVAFGYNPIDAANDPFDIDNFKGYPELIDRSPIRVTNAACEGETSASFLDVTAPDNGCHSEWRAAGKPLHATYASPAESQLGFALRFLARHPRTDTVSVQIGANDLLVLRGRCIATYAPDVAAIGQCVSDGAPAAIGQAAANVGTILGAIRQSGYRGDLVVVTYHATQYANAADPDLQAVVGLDQALVTVAKTPALQARVARGFSAFAAASRSAGGDACRAGLLYALPDRTCDKHPSRRGHAVLAEAVWRSVPAANVDVAGAQF